MRTLKVKFSGWVFLLCLTTSVWAQSESEPIPEPDEKIVQETPVPKIPEPMIFDLMRPLHAKAGELEINAVGIFPHRRRAHWAPEMEYAVADGVAVEIEFPFENLAYDSTKLGLQFRLGHDAHRVHGVQLLAQKSAHSSETALNALYLYGHRFNDTWSLMSMSGIQAVVGREQRPAWKGLQNLTLFHDTSDSLVTGLEVNWAFSRQEFLEELLVMPQIHYKLNDSLTLQSGVGWGRDITDQGRIVYGARLILEL